MFVVDASVVTKWFVSQLHSDIAERVQASRRPLLAPQLMISEVTDALRKHVRVRDITLGQASAALQSPAAKEALRSMRTQAQSLKPGEARSLGDKNPRRWLSL